MYLESSKNKKMYKILRNVNIKVIKQHKTQKIFILNGDRSLKKEK